MKRELVWVSLLFIFISIFIFYPLLKGFIPFPGDLLVGEYAPYSSYSFFGYAPGGFPNKAQDFDVLRLLFPGKEFSIRQLTSFEIPFWNPYNFSGNPHLASLQSGTFYPLNIVFLLFSFNFAWSIYITIQPILTGLFTYFLLREFRLSIKSSIFGGIVFAFSSYQVVWMEYGNIGHTILWLPFLMLFSLKYLKKPSIVSFLLLIFALTFSIFAGYIQTTSYVFAFLFAFIIFEIFNTYRDQLLSKLITFIPIFILPVFLSAIQFLPTIELFVNSARSPYSLPSFLKLLIPNVHLATLFVPDFFGNPATRNYWLNGTYIERVSYIGIIPLLFAVYAVLRKPTKLIWFFIGSAAIIYLITFNSVLSRAFYSIFFLPIISTAVPSRIMFIFCFSASVLAAFGFEYLQKDKINKKFFISAIFIGAVFVLLWIFVFIAPFIFKSQPWIQNLNISKRNLVIPSTLFLIGTVLSYLLFKLKNLKSYIFMPIFLLTILDLFLFFQKITPFAPSESIYPKTEVLDYLKKIQEIDRSWGYGSGYIDANIQTHEKVFSTNGYDALHIRRYGELLTASKDGKILELIPRSDADIASGYGEDDLRNNYFRQKLLNLLGVKYILHKITPDTKYMLPDTKTFPENIYKLIWQKGYWQIYENKQSLSRIFLASAYTVIKNKQDIIDKIYNPSFNLKETVILEEPLVKDFKLQKDVDAKVILNGYLPNKIILQTNSSTNTLLFVSDNYYPGWKVTIDGAEEKIYRADYSFRAVPVKKGQHTVVFSYYPESFSWGVKISLASFFSIIVYVAIKKRKQNV